MRDIQVNVTDIQVIMTYIEVIMRDRYMYICHMSFIVTCMSVISDIIKLSKDLIFTHKDNGISIVECLAFLDNVVTCSNADPIIWYRPLSASIRSCRTSTVLPKPCSIGRLHICQCPL
jgi:hypothetical protein